MVLGKQVLLNAGHLLSKSGRPSGCGGMCLQVPVTQEAKEGIQVQGQPQLLSKTLLKNKK